MRTQLSESLVIVDPVGLDNDADALWLRDLPADTEILVDWQISEHWGGHRHRLNAADRDVLVQVLLATKDPRSSRRKVAIPNTSGWPDTTRMVRLADIRAIRIEVWS